MVATKCGYIRVEVSSGRPSTTGTGDANRMSIASFRVYGGKLTWGSEAFCRNRGRGVELRTRRTHSDGICKVVSTELQGAAREGRYHDSQSLRVEPEQIATYVVPLFADQSHPTLAQTSLACLRASKQDTPPEALPAN